MNILTNVDLHGGQVLNVAIQNLSQAPAEKTSGQIYYNTQDKRVYCWTGENWLPLDAKDASPTAVSIVRTINDGTSLINTDKVKDLATKLGADSLVQTINDGSANINADRIQGLSTAISGESIVSKINEGDRTIEKEKVDGLVESLKNDTIVANINAGSKTINTDKITGLDTALANKETPQGAQEKANTALQQAKEYAKSEITKVVGGASEAYDTLKEIEDALKKNDSLDKTINKAIKNKTSKYAQDVGDGANSTIAIKHNLKTQDVSVTLREKDSPFAVVYTDVEITDENTVTLKFAKAPKLNEYRIIVIG
ncbi:hypothetical protein [Peptostreptococcus anaerobius]|uniref:hypothetical protein n=1 Tax=Peptostreptococcus anaerobius TaxID=1261 RepID=UPI003D6E0C33